jgi:signal transduction histidine kinase
MEKKHQNTIIIDNETYDMLIRLSAGKGLPIELVTREAIIKYGKIEEKNEQMFSESKFRANVMAHQMLLPVQALIGKTDYLNYLIDKDPTIKPEIKEISSELVNDLIKVFFAAENIRSFTKDESIPKFELERLNIISMVEDAIRLFKGEAKARNIKLVGPIYCTETIPFIEGSKTQLSHALYNLVSNAIKYSYENNDVKITLAATKKCIIINISNIGVGIQKEEFVNDLIFTRGYRGLSAINHNIIGSGLGLNISKKIITRHKGNLKVVSKPLDDTKNAFFNNVRIVLPKIQEGNYVSKDTLD